MPQEEETARSEMSLHVLAAVLGTIKTAADIVAVPFLAQAVDLALTLIQTVETMKSNQSQFRSLAEETCLFICAIHSMRIEVTESVVTLAYLRALQAFHRAMEEISCFAIASADKKWWARFLKAQSDLEKIGELRQKLSIAVQLFNIAQTHAVYLICVQQYARSDDEI
ncbi:hypothetical protein BDN72DRAFT_841354 [Pluteus cervinus]|uniref:Uncharacterized protein n=1 Tax=Pluteus cervinus TaxID=181527 RepID=A0ACD3AT57_9AGAR|nr:hypothetical protein BDN72DRAFT_841354 [Pluteus cervinus]